MGEYLDGTNAADGLDDLDETGLFLRLNHAKAVLSHTTDLEERAKLHNAIGDLSDRIHKLRREAARVASRVGMT